MRPSLLLRLTAAAGATAAVLAAAPAAGAADAVYGGTSGDDAIVLKGDSKFTTLRSIAISWRATCDDGSWVPGGGVLTSTKAVPGFTPGRDELLMSQNAKGRFAGTQLSATDFGAAAAGIVVEIKGKLKPARASGTLKVTVTIVDKATSVPVTTCRASQRFDAARAPGTVYGGATSQGEPIVLRLNPARKRVSDVLLTWRAPCTPDGFFRVPEHLVGFPVKSTGAFGGPFKDNVTMDAGGTRSYDYAFAGKLSKTAAKGTLQVKIADTDAAGASASACDTGAVTWKATTG